MKANEVLSQRLPGRSESRVEGAAPLSAAPPYDALPYEAPLSDAIKVGQVAYRPNATKVAQVFRYTIQSAGATAADPSGR